MWCGVVLMGVGAPVYMYLGIGIREAMTGDFNLGVREGVPG